MGVESTHVNMMKRWGLFWDSIPGQGTSVGISSIGLLVCDPLVKQMTDQHSMPSSNPLAAQKLVWICWLRVSWYKVGKAPEVNFQERLQRIQAKWRRTPFITGRNWEDLALGPWVMPATLGWQDTMPLFHDALWRVTAIDIEYTLAKVMQRVLTLVTKKSKIFFFAEVWHVLSQDYDNWIVITG